jgi:protease secretion system outer membrane protein
MLRAGAAAITLALLVPGTQAQALRLGQALEAARGHDPALRAATYQRDAAAENLPIAQGAMLPQVSLSASVSGSSGRRQFANSTNQPVEVPIEYTSPQASLSVRWPLFNLEGLAAVDLARAQADLADQQLRADTLSLTERAAAAYFELLEAAELHRLALVQVDAAAVAAEQARRREADGEGTRVLTAKEEANLELARSRAAQVLTRLQTAREALRRITGLPAFDDPLPPPAWTAAPLVPGDFEAWVEQALRSNPMVQVRQWAVTAAQAQLQRSRAGHAPRLDLVGSIAHTSNDALSTIGQSSQLRSLGLQLQLPLFSGGSTSAVVRQAHARELAAEEDLRREREQLRLELMRQWQRMTAAAQREQALLAALEASALALRGAARSRDEGLSTVADEAALRNADIDLRQQTVQARVERVMARIRLQIQAGLPPQEIVDGLDALWTARKSDGTS